jgi:hypothetical protein
VKIGSLVYATDSGLGLLAKSFYDHGVITHPLVVRHGRFPTHDDWFPGAPQITALRNPAQQEMARRYCAGCDVVLFLETPHLWPLIPHCRERGVKTVLMPMYECMPERLPYQPDLFICPSLLDQRYYPDRSVFLPVPVEVPWRQRTRAEVFVANLGHGGLKGRNGGEELYVALQYVKNPVRLTLRTQEQFRGIPGERTELHIGNVTVDYRRGTFPYETLWDEGDVFVHPTKWDALSLPLQEARAAGMLCMTGDRFPMSEWLPKEGLFPVHHTTRERVGPPYNPIDVAHYDPKAIAAKIDSVYGTDISAYSLAGKAWAETMSWSALRPKYMQALEALVS